MIFKDWCTILMGVMFSFFVVVQLLNYASSELEVWTSEPVNLKFRKHMILDVRLFGG